MVHGSDLIWQCVKKQSCFLRKSKESGPVIMSAEPGNLTGANKQKYSSLSHETSIGIHSKITGKKEKIIITAKAQKLDSISGGKNHHHIHGVSKGAKKAVPGLAMFLRQRPDLATELVEKYHKVKKSFKKKTVLARSRRAPKA